MILVLCGKSGSGKDTILKELVKDGFTPIVTTTTRPMRQSEKQGVEYNFVNNDKFFKMLQDGEFLETRQFHTVNCGKSDIWYYGTTVSSIDNTKNNVMVLDLNGTKVLTDYFGKQNCYVVYIDVMDEVRTIRAKRRKPFDECEWHRRMIADDEDFTEDKIASVANVTINNNFDNVSYAVENIERLFNVYRKAHSSFLGGYDNDKL